MVAALLADIQATGRETQRDVRQLMIQVEPLAARIAHIEEDVKAHAAEIGALSAWRWRAAGVIAVGGLLVGWPLQALASDILAK
jgi:outer membrane murein-binding lipoprotein Lpp